MYDFALLSAQPSKTALKMQHIMLIEMPLDARANDAKGLKSLIREWIGLRAQQLMENPRRSGELTLDEALVRAEADYNRSTRFPTRHHHETTAD